MDFKNDTKLKVCLLNDSFPPVIDGVANTVVNYANVMTEKNIADVIVGTPKYKEGDYDSYPYPVVAYKSINIADAVEGYRMGNPMSMHYISKLIDFQPDVIHSHCPVISNLVARIVRKQTDAPIIFTYHTKFDYDIAKAVSAKSIQNGAIRALVNNVEASDEVWVVSNGAGENLRSLGYEGDYRVMINGVDFPKGRVDADTVAEVTKGYDLPEGVPVFLFVGRIMTYKGLPMILDAMKMLDEKNIDFRMVFIGGGVDEDELKTTTTEYGLDKKVIFTGPVYDRDALRAWNTRADLFLFPSVFDTNGLVVREAAACGLASVLIKNSCAAEGIEDGRNGFLIDENAEAMAALLTEVIKDLSHLAEVGQHAMDEIYVSWESCVRTAYDRYGEVIELNKAGKLKPHTHQISEAFLNASASIVNNTEKILDTPKNLYEGMRENISERHDYRLTGLKQALEGRFKDYL